ncbi:hypothetical protein Tco_0148061, partial [Tanacetum coccineum]
MKVIILTICIGFQIIVVVACKMIALIPIFIVILKAMYSDTSIVLEQNHENYNDHRRYVLQQLHDSMELSERTLKSILNYVDCSIQKAKKRQSNNLIKLLEESRSFEGVGKYDILQDPTSPKAYIDCWSLALVTLTTITSSLPKIQNETFKSFLKGVREGLAYVTDVEKSLNATDDYITTQKAAKKLWEEVDIHHKWLGNLKRHAPEVNAAAKILRWFNDTAKIK